MCLILHTKVLLHSDGLFPVAEPMLTGFHLQNQLLEVGWNRSEATQQDVEKTLNCCGFSHVPYNASCPAVSVHTTRSRHMELMLPEEWRTEQM